MKEHESWRVAASGEHLTDRRLKALQRSHRVLLAKQTPAEILFSRTMAGIYVKNPSVMWFTPQKLIHIDTEFSFFVDFYNKPFSIGIELDGRGHFTQKGKAYDDIRTRLLSVKDVVVLRYENATIEHDVYAVIQQVFSAMFRRSGRSSRKRVLSNELKRLSETKPDIYKQVCPPEFCIG